MSVLSKITARAKQLRKKHPNSKWTSLVKKAGQEYRAGKLGSSKPAKPKYRQTGSSSKKYDQMRTARPPGPRIPAGGTKVTYTERRKNRSDVPGKLTGMSATTLKSELRNRYKETLGKQLVQRELTKGKLKRRKIQKKITQTKTWLKRLQ